MGKVIVTGASGQIGSYMVDHLLENTDHEVVGAVRRTSQVIDSHFRRHLDNPRFRTIHFDLCDPNSISSTIKNEKPDFFINFGAQSFVADSWETPALHFQTNALAVLNILEAVRVHIPECRVYLSGSSEQFGDVIYSPQDEKHPFRPRSPYGAAKCAAHHITKVWRESYGLYAVQGLLFNNESERRQSYFVTRKITKGLWNAKRLGEPLKLGNIRSKRDWSHSEDMADGVWKMLNAPLPKDYVLASGEAHTVKEFVDISFRLIYGANPEWTGEGLDEKLVHDGRDVVTIDEKFYRPAEVDILLGDSSLARKELGWSPKTSFPELIKKMVDNDEPKQLSL